MDQQNSTECTAMDAALQPNPTMGRRNVIAGMAGLGIAAGLGPNRVRAQEATPSADDDTDDDGVGGETSDGDIDAEIGAAYQNFVGKLAANLGQTDTTAVDTAIRDALKAIVDEEFAAGDISQNLATELKDRIDTSPAPLRLGGLRRLRRGRLKRRRDDEDDDDTDDQGDIELPTGEVTPST